MKAQQTAMLALSNEQGLMLPLFALILVAAVGMMALVIDHSKESHSLETLQRASDAAGLAGARQLDSTRSGWLNAKKAAVLALKNNPIHGLSRGSLNGLRLDQGPNGYWGFSTDLQPGENSPTHSGTTGTKRGLDVTVERGVMWYDQALNDDLGGYRFISLEGDSPQVKNGKWLGVIESYMIANAVKVRVNLQKLPTVFGRVIGFGEFTNLAKTSVAVSDTNLEIETAPFAIPYCQLKLNTDPNSTGHDTDRYDSASQRRRELVFTEANPERNLLSWKDGTLVKSKVGSETEKRREGITRFKSHIGRTYSYYTGETLSPCFSEIVNGMLPNCKELVMWGTLGKPSDSPGETTESSELDTLFDQARQGKLKAKLGGFFAPLEELPSEAEAERAATAMDNFILSGKQTFQDTFMSGPLGDFAVKNGFPLMKTIRPNPPIYSTALLDIPGTNESTQYEIILNDHERRVSMKEKNKSTGNLEEVLTYDLRIEWPTNVSSSAGSAEPTWIRMLMDHQTKLSSSDTNIEDTRQNGAWTNPLCHSNNASFLGDNPRQPVKRVRAMVVAPQQEGFEYCDFDAVFGGYQQAASAVVGESNAQILGLVEVEIFDGNILDLDADEVFEAEKNNATLPNYGNLYEGPMRRRVSPHYPGYNGQVIDRNPGELATAGLQYLEKLTKKVKTYEESFYTCVDAPCSKWKTVPVEDSEEDADQGNEETEQVCVEYEDCEASARNVRTAGHLVDANTFPAEFYECFDMNPVINSLQDLDILMWICVKFGNTFGMHVCKSENAANFEQLFARLERILEEQNIRSRTHAHCLNQMKAGKFDRSDPDSYEPLRPLYAGHGCGGVRGRLVHDSTSRKVWPSGSSHLESSPALVKEDS